MMPTEHSVGNLAAIPPNEGRMLKAGDRLVTVFHLRSGAVRATSPWCPHQGGRLADGLIGDGRVVCPLHNRTYCLDTGAGEPGEQGIETFPARVEADGTIVVTLPEVQHPVRREVRRPGIERSRAAHRLHAGG
jgi:nitrite reductase (NADH) small subunit